MSTADLLCTENRAPDLSPARFRRAIRITRIESSISPKLSCAFWNSSAKSPCSSLPRSSLTVALSVLRTMSAMSSGAAKSLSVITTGASSGSVGVTDIL